MQSFMFASRMVLLRRSAPLTVLRCATFAAKSERTLGEEKNYVNKQEEQLLKNLLKKVKDQAAKDGASEEKMAAICEKEIRALCTKYKVAASDNLIKDLLSWKAEK